MGSVATRHWSQTTSCATLRARHLDEGRCWLLELSGEADVATRRLLRDELARLLAVDRDERVVDVSNLAFCDVASAHQLLTARRSGRVALQRRHGVRAARLRPAGRAVGGAGAALPRGQPAPVSSGWRPGSVTTAWATSLSRYWLRRA